MSPDDTRTTTTPARNRAAPPATAPHTAVQVWLLRYWDKHEDATHTYYSYTDALAALATIARSNWDNIIDRDGVPRHPHGLPDHDTVTAYFGVAEPGECSGGDRGPDEGYVLYPDIVAGTPPTTVTLHTATLTAAVATGSAATSYTLTLPGLTITATPGLRRDTVRLERDHRLSLAIPAVTLDGHRLT